MLNFGLDSYFEHEFVSTENKRNILLVSVLGEFGLIGLWLLIVSIFPFFAIYMQVPESVPINFSVFSLDSWSEYFGKTVIGFNDKTDFVLIRLYWFALAYTVISPWLIWKKNSEGNMTRTYALIKREFKENGKYSLKQIILTYLVKLLFIPLMFSGVVIYGESLFELIISLFYKGIASKGIVDIINYEGFSFVFNLVMFSSLLIYLFGYVVESKQLGSEIDSVEPTFFGWLVTIICYLPFIVFVSWVIPFGTQDFAFFINEEITAAVRVLLTIVMMTKMWAIINMGSKSSNLTSRGVCRTGPYKYIRHPHYACKLIVWWIGLIPSAIAAPWLLGGMVFWTVIYFLRALTEEKHLSANKDYIDYKKEVKWMFIPKVI